MTGSIRNVGVVGSGTMGQGIAHVCAAAGYGVLLYDIDPTLPEKAISGIRTDLEMLAGKGKIPASAVETVLARIRPVTDITTLQADLIIEAVVEDRDVKQKIFRQLEPVIKDTCLLTTNTSSLSVTSIGTGLTQPGRFAGLHFFNPAPAMKLVEIIRGAFTDETTIRSLQDFCASLNKQFVIAHDSPGFIVNRVARHFYLESLRIVEEHVTDLQTVDALLASTGFRMGPFALMDLIGIDVNLRVSESIFNAFHQEPRFRPSALQQEMVNAGHLGRKTGRGFYIYDASRRSAAKET